MAVVIRDIVATDEAAWRVLWAAYIAFQKGIVAPEVTAHTWARLNDPARSLIGRVAEVDGCLRGFSVSLLHEGTWALTPFCYLEDLFVAEHARGQGLGRALIEDLITMGMKRGWARLYWHAMAGNAEARRLYDSFAPSDGDVRYRIQL